MTAAGVSGALKRVTADLPPDAVRTWSLATWSDEGLLISARSQQSIYWIDQGLHRSKWDMVVLLNVNNMIAARELVAPSVFAFCLMRFRSVGSPAEGDTHARFSPRVFAIPSAANYKRVPSII